MGLSTHLALIITSYRVTLLRFEKTTETQIAAPQAIITLLLVKMMYSVLCGLQIVTNLHA